jgi:DNA topoisomerase 2
MIQEGKLVSSFKENHTDTEVSFTVNVKEEAGKELRNDLEKTMKEFKLVSTVR